MKSIILLVLIFFSSCKIDSSTEFYSDFYWYEHYPLQGLNKLHNKTHCSYTVSYEDSVVRLRLNDKKLNEFHQNDSLQPMHFFEFDLYDSTSTLQGYQNAVFLVKSKNIKVQNSIFRIDCYKSRLGAMDGVTTLFYNKELGCLAFYLDSHFSLILNQKNHNNKLDLIHKKVVEKLLAEKMYLKEIEQIQNQ
ncbi:hypothetical protein [Sediminitomix flava]|uniref:Uncharacterized protein n=1 Tax=Sediminitomix flava TaxID=379075 RepID=A0A315Z4V3_SEDFL|nr:hypothetical protein [Sediminitomix flava]PWJ37903.1 hypothetical protein BC781_10838 [Sediminitomix flava]